MDPEPLESVPDTVDALLSHTTPALLRQYSVADTLDQKTLGILGISGALITIAGVGQANGAPPDFAVALLLLAGAHWLAVSAVALAQLWTRHYRAGLSPDRWVDHRFYEPFAVKTQLLIEAAEAYRENRDLNRSKARALRWAIIGAVLEALLVGAALAVWLLA